MEFSIERSVEILSRTPGTVSAMLAGLPDVWIHCGTGESDWGPFDILGHYIHCEEADWIPRARLILTQGESLTFEPLDRLAQFKVSEGKGLAELLDTFARLRRENIETLRSWNLTEQELELKGIHPELGEVTLRQLIATWVVHDLTHIRHIANVMARQYGENVGPWRAYLSILQS